MGANDQRVQRRLAAILAADVVGFSTRMNYDEEGTLEEIKDLRQIVMSTVYEHRGRLVKTTGDGFLIEFASPVEAVRCALAVQTSIAAGPLQLRIGINLGDVLVEPDGDVYGDGVNVAARLEQLAPPGGVYLSGKVYEELRDRLPYCFEDRGEQSVKNIARPVRVYSLQGPAAARNRPPQTAVEPDQPSIAVLPFLNYTANPEHEFFADGMQEDITNGLSRLRWLFVISRGSTFQYKGKSADHRAIARELGVRYIVDGSVRSAADRIRVTTQLVDARSGQQLWAQRYDRQVADIFALQDEITDTVTATIEPQLYAAEGTRTIGQPPERISTWGLVVRAIGLMNRVGRVENEEAVSLLRRAIEVEPNYAKAHAILSWAVFWAAFNYWMPDEVAGRHAAQRHAERALALDPSEPWARMVLGLCVSSEGKLRQAVQELEAALQVNPSFALGHVVYGWVLAREGQFDRAVEATAKALRLSPSDSFVSFFEFIHGVALMMVQRFHEALPYLRRAAVAFPEVAAVYGLLISCCGYLGLVDEAQELLAHRNTLGPPLTVNLNRHQMRNFATGPVIAEGLAKAGVPE